MGINLPYVAQPSLMPKILDKVREAKVPDRFTQDFLSTVLGFKGGNYNQFISLAKKIGLLNGDGSPSDLYKQFRNPSTSKAAMAEAIKIGYPEIFNKNEYAYKLDSEKLKGIIVEITGLEQKSQVLKRINSTFKVLNELADFEKEIKKTKPTVEAPALLEKPSPGKVKNDFGLNLAYTINLVLPKSDDPAVFNAIFKSLKENLLRD